MLPLVGRSTPEMGSTNKVLNLCGVGCRTAGMGGFPRKTNDLRMLISYCRSSATGKINQQKIECEEYLSVVPESHTLCMSMFEWAVHKGTTMTR